MRECRRVPTIKLTPTEAELGEIDRQRSVASLSRAQYCLRRALGRPIISLEYAKIRNQLAMLALALNEHAQHGAVPEAFCADLTNAVENAIVYLSSDAR